jgi:hypothetical protein
LRSLLLDADALSGLGQMCRQRWQSLYLLIE